MHEAQVALLDEVQEGEARRLVLLGDGDDQAQVGLHEGALGADPLGVHPAQLALAALGQAVALGVQVDAGLVPGLDGLGQADLVILGQQRELTDIGEVQADEVFLVPLDSLLGHDAVLLPWCSASDD